MSLMRKWGISYQEFIKTPYEVILELLAYEEAENEGKERQQSSNQS